MSEAIKTLPYGKQTIEQDDIDAVVKVLRSNWITQGPQVELFEKAIAEYCGSRYAVVVSSGTAGLHLACLAANLKSGDEVITSPITFVATANAVVYSNARPIFADINPKTANIDPQEIERKLTRRTSAILPVHFRGLMCEMKAIYDTAKKRNLTVIEDACHALGASQHEGAVDSRAGSCRYSDMSVFSFHPVKHITTGEGGAVTTNNRKIYDRLKMLRTHGIIKNKKMKGKPWYYEQVDLGFNYRMTDMQCALGLSQLRKIDRFVARRKEIAEQYRHAFQREDFIKLLVDTPDESHSYHLFVILLDFQAMRKTRSEIMKALSERGIMTQVHYIPVHTQPYYRKRFGTGFGDCPQSESYYKKCLSLPMYPTMTDSDVERVIDTVKRSVSGRQNK